MQRHLYAWAMLLLTPSVLSSFTKNREGRPKQGWEHLWGSQHHVRAGCLPRGWWWGQPFGSNHTTCSAISLTGEIIWNHGSKNIRPTIISPRQSQRHFYHAPKLPEQLISSHTEDQHFPLPLHFFFFFKKTVIHIILTLQNKLQVAGYLRPHLWNSAMVFLQHP